MQGRNRATKSWRLQAEGQGLLTFQNQEPESEADRVGGEVQTHCAQHPPDVQELVVPVSGAKCGALGGSAESLLGKHLDPRQRDGHSSPLVQVERFLPLERVEQRVSGLEDSRNG